MYTSPAAITNSANNTNQDLSTPATDIEHTETSCQPAESRPQSSMLPVGSADVSKGTFATAPLVSGNMVPCTPMHSLVTRSSVPVAAYSTPITASLYTTGSSVAGKSAPHSSYSATKGYYSTNTKTAFQQQAGTVQQKSGAQVMSAHYTSSSLGTGYVSGYASSIGQQQMVHSGTRVDHTQQRVIAERVIEHEVKVPKKITREDVVEKVIVVPEKIVHEEVIEDVHKVRERIVEVAMPVIQEKIVEVPEIEYVEKVVEVPEVIIQEKIREVPRIEYQERIVEVIKPVIQEKIIEVPEIEYRDVPVEKIVEVPEIREQVVIREIPIPQYVEKPVAEYVDVQQEQEIVRTIPVPVEAITVCEFKLPRLRATPKGIDVPLYVPRFVEVPIPMDVMDTQTIAQAEAYASQISMLAASSAVSLCDVETMASTLRQANLESVINSTDHASLIAQYWASGRLQVDPLSMCYTTSSATMEGLIESSQYHTGSGTIIHSTTEPVIKTVCMPANHSIGSVATHISASTTHHTQDIIASAPKLVTASVPSVTQYQSSTIMPTFVQVAASPAASVSNKSISSATVMSKQLVTSSEGVTNDQAEGVVVADNSPQIDQEDQSKVQQTENEPTTVAVHGSYTEKGTPLNGPVAEPTDFN